MSKNKNLLNENTIRRMMKLASVDSLSDSFISTKYSPLSESVEEETVEEGTKKDDELKDDEGGRGEKKGDEAYVNEEEAAEEMEDAMDSMDDAEDKMDDAMDDAEALNDIIRAVRRREAQRLDCARRREVSSSMRTPKR